MSRLTCQLNTHKKNQYLYPETTAGSTPLAYQYILSPASRFLRLLHKTPLCGCRTGAVDPAPPRRWVVEQHFPLFIFGQYHQLIACCTFRTAPAGINWCRRRSRSAWATAAEIFSPRGDYTTMAIGVLDLLATDVESSFAAQAYAVYLYNFVPKQRSGCTWPG